ncbi:MAG: hypothetical protein LBE14_06850, partial [Treponema sp.]|nr:hypothetical protein [Treponema sp.]
FKNTTVYFENANINVAFFMDIFDILKIGVFEEFYSRTISIQDNLKAGRRSADNKDTREQYPGYLCWRGNLYWPAPYPRSENRNTTFSGVMNFPG